MGLKGTNCTSQTTKFNHQNIFFTDSKLGSQNTRKTGTDVYIWRTTSPRVIAQRSMCFLTRVESVLRESRDFFSFLVLMKMVFSFIN